MTEGWTRRSSGLITRRAALLGALTAAAEPHLAGAYPLGPVLHSALAYPAGRAPGFVPHPWASPGLLYSGVASGNTFLNILTGVKAATTNTTAAVGPFGPMVNISSTGVINVTLPAGFGDGVAGHAVSCGIIYNLSANSGTYGLISTTNTRGPQLQVSAGVLQVLFAGLASTNSSIAIAPNTWYLSWMGVYNQQSPSSYTDLITLNLQTGQLQTQYGLVCSSNGNRNGNTSGYIGYHMNGSVAAAFFDNVYPRRWPSGLLGAADPWAFWYPRQAVHS